MAEGGRTSEFGGQTWVQGACSWDNQENCTVALCDGVPWYQPSPLSTNRGTHSKVWIKSLGGLFWKWRASVPAMWVKTELQNLGYGLLKELLAPGEMGRYRLQHVPNPCVQHCGTAVCEQRV